VRATQSGLLAPDAVRRAVWIALVAALASGLPLVYRGGVPIVVIGLASMLGAVAYSAGPYPLASLGLGELMAFLFFGLVAVSGTAYLHLSRVPPALLAGAAVGSSRRRHARQQPSRHSDRRAREHGRSPVRIGDASAQLYAALVVGAFVVAAGLAAGQRRVGPMLVVSVAPLAVKEIRGVVRRRGASSTRASRAPRDSSCCSVLCWPRAWLRDEAADRRRDVRSSALDAAPNGSRRAHGARRLLAETLRSGRLRGVG
jgi:1,4-dihydroxy-2-naphthoate octaprenyltransferase